MGLMVFFFPLKHASHPVPSKVDYVPYYLDIVLICIEHMI